MLETVGQREARQRCGKRWEKERKRQEMPWRTGFPQVTGSEAVLSENLWGGAEAM